jgi:glycosyltransferase involved in cell wall biosynthesis
VTDETPETRKVVICTPTYIRPHPAFLEALEASVPALDAAGIDHSTTWRVGSPYISHARSELLRRALSAKADDIVFIDHDIHWKPEDLVRLIQTEGDVVSGAYRYKIEDDEGYMGRLWPTESRIPETRADGCVRAEWIPAGFMKITKEAVDRFMRAYPELCYGPRFDLSVDLFNHGAHDGLWWGEDYAFSRRWVAMGEEIWVIPDLDLTHHSATKAFPGNYHDYLRRQEGGDRFGQEPCWRTQHGA